MLPNRTQRLPDHAGFLPSETVRTKHSASGLAAPVVPPLALRVPPPPAAGPRKADALYPRRRGFLHLHRYAWYAEDQFSGHNIYACRCGRVRPGL